MNKTRRQIECLQRLEELASSRDEILAFLLGESLITKEEIKAIRSAPDPSKELQIHLTSISTNSKIQLLEYEWALLPIERVKILIVTDRNSREFSYNS